MQWGDSFSISAILLDFKSMCYLTSYLKTGDKVSIEYLTSL